MKHIITLLFSSILFGCITNVSNKSPHNKLVGTKWKANTDAYIIKYNNNERGYLIAPCSTNLYSGYFPDRSHVFREKNIGRNFDDNKTVCGVIRKGDTFTIVKVLKESNPEMGISYAPTAIPTRPNEWTKMRELNASLLYEGFYTKGVLNPTYAELVK